MWYEYISLCNHLMDKNSGCQFSTEYVSENNQNAPSASD